MQVEIRPYEPDELRRFFEVVSMAFGANVHEADLESNSRIFEQDRSLCAFEAGAMVATAAAFSFHMTIPGGELPAAGVTAVGVLPSHRRRGILTSLMRRQLDDVRSRGEPLAILWASEGGIYQRYGYGLASLAGNIHIDRSRTAYRADFTPPGRMRLIETDEAATLLPPIYERVRRTVPGALTRAPAWWEAETLNDPEHWRRGGGPLFRAIYEVDGRAEGYALYRINSSWDQVGPASTLMVREALGTSAAATAAVWRYLFDVDLVADIKASLVQADHPLLLLLAEPRRLRLSLSDGLWLRILDLPAALGPRSYAAEDSLVLQLTDAFCPWNEGRWRLETGPTGGSVSTTRDRADLILDETDLAAAYLGAFSFGDLAAAGRVIEANPGAARRADAAFRTDRAPWSPGMF